jgi:predicted amidophosphoribosyltransferase
MQNSLIVSRPAEISGASVLLIDDVLTTGATLEVAAGLLRDQSALHVDAAVIARHLLG